MSVEHQGRIERRIQKVCLIMKGLVYHARVVAKIQADQDSDFVSAIKYSPLEKEYWFLPLYNGIDNTYLTDVL